jgi:predicted component of type VI protein secretion system
LKGCDISNISLFYIVDGIYIPILGGKDMNDLYQLMNNEENKKQRAEKIIELFEPKIKKSILQTTTQDREDLSQTLKIKLFETIQSYDMASVPGFSEFKEMVRKTS